MRRRPSGGLLWPEDSHEVFHGQKTVMKFSMAKRPSRGLLWLQYHKRVQVQENVKRCSMARKPSVDILWLEDSQKVFYGQETFRSCSVTRKSSGGLLWLENHQKIPPASFFDKPVRRYSKYRIPSGGLLFLEDCQEVFYVQKTVFFEKKNRQKVFYVQKTAKRSFITRSIISRGPSVDLLRIEDRQKAFNGQTTDRRSSKARNRQEVFYVYNTIRGCPMFILKNKLFKRSSSKKLASADLLRKWIFKQVFFGKWNFIWSSQEGSSPRQRYLRSIYSIVDVSSNYPA